VCRDYKTFEKAPSLDADLDFQAKSYIATLMQKYQTDKVRFEHVYIRRYPPNVPKQTRAGDSWTPDECYFYEPIVIPKAEAKILWGEVCVAAIMIERKSTVSVTPPGMWYRVPLKGASPYTCGSCFYKGVCKAELNGPLDPDTIQALGYKQRTPPPVDLTAFTKNSKDFFA
jgi:hypothetical protein